MLRRPGDVNDPGALASVPTPRREQTTLDRLLADAAMIEVAFDD